MYSLCLEHCKQRQADNISDDHNAIHAQQLMIRASCVYHLYKFLSALNIQGVSVYAFASVLN